MRIESIRKYTVLEKDLREKLGIQGHIKRVELKVTEEYQSVTKYIIIETEDYQ